ncbi:MAG: AarF/UbiB family protein [Myxococcota bacterium]
MVSILSTVRDIERLRQIVTVLIRHGFGEVVERTGIGRALRTEGKRLSDGPPAAGEPARAGVGARLRLVLQDLGPSFVKLGQILSTRPDVLPPDIIAELKLLQDRVPPVDFEELRLEIERELGAPVNEIYQSFDEIPLASASIAQVHRAVIVVDGEPAQAVVKIQRPNIKNTVERDIELLYLLARAIERSIPEARIYSPVGLVSEFDRAIIDELDFSREADHSERFRRSFEGDPEVRFPKIYKRASAKKVLTMEFLPGKKLHAAVAAGYSGERIAKTTLKSLLKQIFEDGFFHGDPHPGNLLILGEPEAPVIGFIDLGLVGRLSPELRDRTIDLMVAAARQDSRGVADALYAIGTPTRRVDRARYEAEVTVLADRYLGKPLKEIELSLLIKDIVGGAVKFGLEIPPEFMMLGRTLMTVEGVGKELYPDLDVYSECRPYFLSLLKQRYSPERLGADALRVASRIGERATLLPERVDDVLSELLAGTLGVRTHDPSQTVAADLLGRRVFSGLTVSAFILGGSMLIASGAAVTWGLMMIAGAGAWAIVHIVRSALLGRGMRRERP